jgi:hypothetical protein
LPARLVDVAATENGGGTLARESTFEGSGQGSQYS